MGYLIFLQNIRTATEGMFDNLMSFVTSLGEGVTPVIIAAFIFWCVDKRMGITALVTYGVGSMLNGVIKITACRYRPWIRDGRITPVKSAVSAATGYSFPSGHTTNAATVYGTFAADKKVKMPLKICLIIIILLIGFSRNYLGVHMLSDVLIALIMSLVLIIIIKYLGRCLTVKPNLDIVYLAVGLLIAILVCVYASLKSYPMDYDSSGKLLVDPRRMAIDTYKGVGRALGVLVGWFLERRFVKYEIQKSFQQRITCFLIGISGYLVIYMSLIKLFSSDMMGQIMGQFVSLFYVTFIVPLCIKLAYKKRINS